ncbi:MAG: stage II sporulation protein P [Clostridia bacterium]|nr:stage II sporulation protein P [Clostridia bacterium]
MEQTPQTPKTPHNQTDREFVFRIIICAVAVLALSAAITFMIRGIVLDANATKRLMAEAFMSYQTETPKTPEETTENQPPVTTAEVPPTAETTTPPGVLEESISLVSASLSQNKAGINNYTSYTVDENALLNHKFEFYTGKSSPIVLILHSHITECYAPNGASAVSATFNFESTDRTENIFAVGEALAEVLSASGIGVIHATEEASNAEELIAEYRTAYPSIRFVLDVHRDGIYTTDGRIVRTDGKIADSPAAELMLAVGTDSANGGSDWQKNLAAAYQLSSMITEAEPNLMRNILLRPEGLGQQYAPSSLSLYVGTTGNTLTEALTSARFFARYYAIFILSAVK